MNRLRGAGRNLIGGVLFLLGFFRPVGHILQRLFQSRLPKGNGHIHIPIDVLSNGETDPETHLGSDIPPVSLNGQTEKIRIVLDVGINKNRSQNKRGEKGKGNPAPKQKQQRQGLNTVCQVHRSPFNGSQTNTSRYRAHPWDLTPLRVQRHAVRRFCPIKENPAEIFASAVSAGVKSALVSQD
ncbi:MAG: hypothetical protein IKT12_07285 [Thermoguttaceae bacterium]|nr:hypothetical protein [Thermoguttaceae bacterium]